MMSHRYSARRTVFIGFAASAPIMVAAAMGTLANAQTVRNYDVQFTSTPPVIDGVVSAGEWNGAAAAAGAWGVLREAEGELDTENNRFRMMWDANNLYILYETNFNIYLDPVDKVGNPNPGISFNDDNLNLYFDPNTDNEPNFVDNPEDTVDGYQLAFNQYHDPAGGSLISTNANRQGVGFFTEAHVDTPFGDQARWNDGVDPAQGPALQNIVVAQRNGTGGGVAEIVFPWANFNADATIPGTTHASDFNSDGFVDGHDFLIWQRGLGLTGQTDKSTGDADADGDVDTDDLGVWKTAYGTDTRMVTGLDHLQAPVNGEKWFFNMSRINGQGDVGNFLPIWNWHSEQSFAFRPHGTITFGGRPISAVPEPTAVVMTTFAAAALWRRRRRAT
jgi:hypothetical protein